MADAEVGAGRTTLETLYQGWENYQNQLVRAIAPLSEADLAKGAGAGLRTIGVLATHIVATRAGWFHEEVGEGTEETAPYDRWTSRDGITRSAAELVAGLETTWRMIRAALARWTPEEMARPFEVEYEGKTYTYTRQWIIWHLLEHDLHHGGELSYSLGMIGRQGIDI
jgi:uncharacterized damage-inducible protein DinB